MKIVNLQANNTGKLHHEKNKKLTSWHSRHIRWEQGNTKGSFMLLVYLLKQILQIAQVGSNSFS